VKIAINLDEVMSGDHWDTTVGEIIRDEIKSAVRAEVRKNVRANPDLKKAIKALEKYASQQIIEAIP
jgi:hypothetical protein